MTSDDAPISLPEVREAIDRIDSDIQRLISERALLAQKVGIAKRGAADNSGYYRADREAQV